MRPVEGVMELVRQLEDSSAAIQKWMKKLGRQATKKSYSYHFYHYFSRYIRGKDLFSSPDEMVKHAENCSSKELYQHLDWLEDYVKFSKFMEGRTASHRNNIVKAVRSFYQENRVPLPKYTIRYDDGVPKGRPQEALALEEVEKIIWRMNDRDKAVFLTMLQGGIGPAELVGPFNHTGYEQIVKQIGELENWWPSGLVGVRVDLVRKKTGYKYYTFISNDALVAIKNWLKVRQTLYHAPLRKGEPLFITNRMEPINEYHLQKQMRINRAPWEPDESDGVRSKFHPHELRDTFQSTCAVAGVDKTVREFFLGHNIDQLGYDKSPWLYPDHFKFQYLKAARMLNIFSKPPEMDKNQMFIELMRSMAPGFGIDPLKVRIEKQRQLGREVTAEEEIQALQLEMKKLRRRQDDPKKIVSESELEQHLAEGWEFVSILPSGKILVSRLVSNT